METFQTIQSQGYFITYFPLTHQPPRLSHKFCGVCGIQGAYCPNCEKPLLHMLSINCRDEKISFSKDRGIQQIPLFFCWRCHIAQEPFYYKLFQNGGVNILVYTQGGVQINFPYPDYPIYFPEGQAILEAIPDDIQHLLSGLNRSEIEESTVREQYAMFCQPRHQVGGEPYLVQMPSDLFCPECGESMPFLCSMGDDCLDPRGFTGNEYVQVLFFYCIHCSVIGVIQQCD